MQLSLILCRGPFRATRSPHRTPLNTPLRCHISRWRIIATGSNAMAHSCTWDHAIALRYKWAIGMGMCGLSFVGHRARSPHDYLSNTLIFNRVVLRFVLFAPISFLWTTASSQLGIRILFWLCSLFHSQTSYLLPYFILKHRHHNVLNLQELSCHLLRWRPNHVWFLPLSPGYVVQGCLHLHYCREVMCHFRQCQFC